MKLLDTLHLSFVNLRAHKLRSFLTMLGIIIGIAAVIIVTSVGSGAQGLILNQVNKMGTNLVGILPGASEDDGPPASAMGITITTLTYEDIQALGEKRNVPHATAVSAYAKGNASVSWQDRSVVTTISGVTASILDVEDTAVSAGRFFDAIDERSMSRVVVLGSFIAEELFGDQDPVGQEVKIKREQFKVIGVMKERGNAFFQNQDDQVFVPLRTAQRLLLGINHLGLARVKVDSVENVDRTIDDIKITLRERHDITNVDEDDFSVRSTAQALEVLGGITDALKFFLVAIAAIALVVGGVGIMNIMLVAVNERIREIGLRKAVGATTAAILLQFLLETILISMIGGLIGVAIGAGISALVAVVANALGYTWQLVISPQSIVVACSVSAGVGLVFGLYPARRASRLDPITALRYE